MTRLRTAALGMLALLLGRPAASAAHGIEAVASLDDAAPRSIIQRLRQERSGSDILSRRAAASISAFGETWYVQEAIADISGAPCELGCGRNPQRETQVRRGDRVRILAARENNGVLFYQVEVRDQLFRGSSGPWRGYPGWIRADAVGRERPRVGALEEMAGGSLRERFINAARDMQGTPYLWGGLSSMAEEGMTPRGVDCSGFIHYALTRAGYRSPIPRDSGDIYSYESESWVQEDVAPAQMEAGDLVFFAHARNGRVFHVAIYAGGGQIIESPETGSTVRLIGIGEKIGREVDLEQMGQGFSYGQDGERRLYFRRFPAQETVLMAGQ